MSSEDLLQEYLDGTLDEQGEAVLFGALSQDSALRREFNEYIHLRSTARKEASAVTPSAALTSAVFAEFGYSRDAGTAAPASVKGKSLWASSSPYILTSLLSSILTGILVVFLLRSGVTSQNTPLQQIPLQHMPMQLPAQQRTAATERTHVQQSDRQQEIHIRHTYQNDRERIFSHPVSQTTSPFVTHEQAVESPAIRPLLTTTDIQQNTLRSPVLPENDLFPVQSPALPNLFPDAGSIEQNIDFSLRSLLTQSAPLVHLPSQTDSRLTSMAFTALYRLSAHHSIGVEIGREAFGQEFKRKDGTATLTIRQNPILWWYATAYRFDLPEAELENIFSPFGALSVGVTQIGPLGRAQLGLRFLPDEFVALTLSAEASTLLYPVDGIWLSSRSFGISYGMSIHF